MTRPSERVVSILRRAQTCPIAVHSGPGGGRWFVYDGGDMVRDANGNPLEQSVFCRWVREGWLLPIEVGRYRSRLLSDPPIERPTKEEDLAREQKPTPQQTAILRRASLHKLTVEFVEGRKQYSYGDGVPVKREDAERLIVRRWVVPESPGLFGDEPQVYVCRSL